MNDSRVHVMVVVESRHGSTLGIAGTLAQRLVARDFRVTVTNPGDCDGLGDADVVVLGSAVYLGKWLKPAVKFVHDHEAELATRPVWLFSSGPLDDGFGIGDGMDADYIARLTEHAHARAHHVFRGRLQRSALGPVEALIAAATHAPTGDFRDWTEINDWADEIADAISAVHVQSSLGKHGSSD
jgi:menaquinone-dependent protoporphyrinogen oxidase